eukprot:GHVN01003064.1.p1 GENE.GHVN01003064.1~~GHVN01003064.1.p1  ORF type:complete len:122 (-),score=12.22 GHVN01003064.1:1794-2159(-)
MGKTATQRHLYYKLLHLFANQRIFNAAVFRLATSLSIERSVLGIQIAERGRIGGCVRFVLQDGVLDVASASGNHCGSLLYHQSTASGVLVSDEMISALMLTDGRRRTPPRSLSPPTQQIGS